MLSKNCSPTILNKRLHVAWQNVVSLKFIRQYSSCLLSTEYLSKADDMVIILNLCMEKHKVSDKNFTVKYAAV